MQNKENYQKQLDAVLDEITQSGKSPTLLLHSCCAPCSSYVLLYLSDYFKITVFYYNPNIYPQKEYFHRVKEQQEFIKKIKTKNPVEFIEGDYNPQDFYGAASGLEHEPEGGKRCYECYTLRLEKTAALAAEAGFDYFTTTLSISPYKNAVWLNEIGRELEKKYSAAYLPADFKKKNGYKRSIELSAEYNLYRQNYCGCVYSQRAEAKED